jgi:hypothetical protein
MTASAPISNEVRFDGVRLHYDSAKSYDELVAALLADIGEHPVPINRLAATTDGWRSYQERVESHVGPSGFMLFGLVDHGAWITGSTQPSVVGGPLVVSGCDVAR